MYGYPPKFFEVSLASALNASIVAETMILLFIQRGFQRTLY